MLINKLAIYVFFQLANAEHHIAALQQCECQKSCVANGSNHPDGSTWKNGCDICSCVVCIYLFINFLLC